MEQTEKQEVDGLWRTAAGGLNLKKKGWRHRWLWR
jgi:hypothetical protein